ncbi:MAG: type VI secretion system tip protein VgrG [Bacteroidota bacterium]
MARKASVQIELEKGGMSISPFSQLVISQHIDWHHSFELRVPVKTLEKAQGTFIADSRDLIGKPIKVGITSQIDKKEVENFFRGIITEVSISKYLGADNEVVLRGQSPTILLEDGAHCASFEEMTLGDVANQVLGAYPQNLLTSDVGPKKNPKHTYLVQYKESNFHFLNRIAAQAGEWFYYDGMSLYVGRKKEDALPLHLGKNLMNFDLGLQMVPSRFTIKAYDYEKNELHESASDDAKVEGLDPNFGDYLLSESEKLFGQTPQHSVTRLIHEKSELDEMALVQKSYQANDLVQASGVSDNIQLKIGSTISVSGNEGDFLKKGGTEDYGNYVITAISHRIDGDGNYQNQFDAIPDSVQVPPRNTHIRKPHCEAQYATVMDNIDPEEMGRVRVSFPWQGDGEMSPWIRLLHPHAGGDHGFYFVPEVGDEVFVGFEHDNPNKPYVLGALYHGNIKPSAWQDPENNIKAIKTKSGNEIQIIDEAGKEEIKIINPGGKNSLSMTLGDGGKITISGGGDVSISAKNSMSLNATDISITASNDLKVQAKNMNTNVDQKQETSVGQEISVSAGTNYSLSAGQNASFSAGMDLSLDGGMNTNVSAGMNYSVSAGIEAKMEGTTTVTISGLNVSVQGQAMTSISGTMLKLN